MLSLRWKCGYDLMSMMLGWVTVPEVNILSRSAIEPSCIFKRLLYLFCRSMFALLYFFYWPLCCLFSDIRILIAALVSSNSPYSQRHSPPGHPATSAVNYRFSRQSVTLFRKANIGIDLRHVLERVQVVTTCYRKLYVHSNLY